MSRTLLNFWLDLFLLTLFLTTIWTTFVIRFVFPPGTLAGGWRLWGASFDHWLEFQFWSLCLFAMAVLVHVMLHWTWVCGVITGRFLRDASGKKRQWNDGQRTLFGVGLMVVLLNILGLGFAAAMLMVQTPSL